MLRFFSIANISLLTRRFRDLSAARVPAIHGWNISGQLCFRPRSNLAFIKISKSIFAFINLVYNLLVSKYSVSYKTNSNVIYSCKYPIVWCPKYRKSVLISGIELRLKDIIQNVCKDCDSEMIEMEVMPDHVHLLVEVDPQYGIHRLVKKIKGRSSRLLRQEFRFLKSKLPTLWTNSYFVSTVGGAPLEIIKQYVEQQKYV